MKLYQLTSLCRQRYWKSSPTNIATASQVDGLTTPMGELSCIGLESSLKHYSDATAPMQRLKCRLALRNQSTLLLIYSRGEFCTEYCCRLLCSPAEKYLGEQRNLWETHNPFLGSLGTSAWSSQKRCRLGAARGRGRNVERC